MVEQATPGVEQRPSGVMGESLPRKEDYRFLTGLGKYVDDLPIPPGALHAHFVRSEYAHARIISIDTREASQLEGVAAVVTGRELKQWTSPLRMAPPIEGLRPLQMETLPTDKVRFDGDLVACVVAEDRYVAEDAAELVSVEYEMLPAATDMHQSVQRRAPLVDESLPTNVVYEQSYKSGDPDSTFRMADRVVEASFSQHRQTHVPIETRGCVAVWDEGRGHLTFHVGTQVPHPYRTSLAARLGLREDQVRVVCPDIGGAFGQKIVPYREELVVAALARELKRPICWREDRRENLSAALQAREDEVRVRAAVTNEGKILAIRAKLLSDFGSYSFFPANYMLQVVAMMIPGPYKLENYEYEMKVVLSNKCPAGPMRAPMAICTWVTEGTIEAIAHELELDPVVVRQRNMLREDDLPYVTASGEIYEYITPTETFRRLLEIYDYDAFRERQEKERRGGRYLGVGLACVVEPTTYGSAFYKMAGIPGSGHESAWVRVEPSGAVNASVGLMSSGNGYETTIAQAVAEGLGVSPETVAVHLGDTTLAPYGMGSRGSRGATTGAGTAFLAAQGLKGKVLAIAARLLNLENAEDLDLRGGRVVRRADPEWVDTGLGLTDIAWTAYLDPLSLPEGMEPGLELHKAYDPPPMTYSNAVHLCEVEVDPKTGRVEILRYLVVEDAGRLINPQIVEGQLHGAVAMGLGGVLCERVVYDEEGHNLTKSLRDYAIPSSREVPEIEVFHYETPNRQTPAGLKGMSEGGVMGAIAAVCNAVSDAVRPFGAVVEEQPLTPEKILDLIRDSERPSAASNENP